MEFVDEIPKSCRGKIVRRLLNLIVELFRIINNYWARWLAISFLRKPKARANNSARQAFFPLLK